MDTQKEEHSPYENEFALYDYWKGLVKRKKLIIGFFLISMAGAAIFSFLMPKIFRAEVNFKLPAKEIIRSKEIIIEKEIISAKEIISIIGKIDKEKIKHIFKKTYNEIDDIKLNTHRESLEKFQLIIDTNKIEDIPIAIAEFVEYIENNPLIMGFVEQYKEMLLKQAAELSEVIEFSNDLVKAYDNLLKRGRLIPVGFNPVDLNKRISDIKIEKLQVEQNLARLKGIELAAVPYISSKPVKPKIAQYILLAGVLSLFLGIFYVSFVEYLARNK